MKIRRSVHLKATSRKNTQTTEEENILCALELRISVKNIGRAKFNSKMINNPVEKKRWQSSAQNFRAEKTQTFSKGTGRLLPSLVIREPHITVSDS